MTSSAAVASFSRGGSDLPPSASRRSCVVQAWTLQRQEETIAVSPDGMAKIEPSLISEAALGLLEVLLDTLPVDVGDFDAVRNGERNPNREAELARFLLAAYGGVENG